MVLCRTRLYHLLPWRLILLGVPVLAVGFAAGFAWAAGADQSQPAGSKARLHELMTQRYEILQRAMKNAERLLENGRMEVPAFQSLTEAMYRAQADLSPTAADRVKVYEKLVEALGSVQQILEQRALAGRATQVEVDQGRLVILDAQIDLERLRLGQAPARP